MVIGRVGRQPEHDWVVRAVRPAIAIGCPDRPPDSEDPYVDLHQQYLAETDRDRLEDRRRTQSTPWPTGWPACASRGGRLFILGVGGSAGHAGHAVNDFRKLCGFEAYAPTDNVAELTARTNDEGWDTTFSAWLEGSRLRAGDGVLVFSVGGGDVERNVSAEHRARPAVGQGARCRRSSAWSAGTAATPPRSPTPPSSSRRSSPSGSRRTPKGCAPSCGTCSSSHPALKHAATKWESVAGDGALSDARASAAASSSSAARGSSAATPSTGCSDAAGIERVTVFDNFSSGRWWHLEDHRDDPRLDVVEADVKDLDALTSAMAGHDLVIHLASNPDIAAAMADPTIDFYEGTLLTHHVAEAVRRTGVAGSIYASGSGVYGDLGEVAPAEDHGPLVPTSTYGASKLAGEALLCSYAHMFGSAGVGVPLRQRRRAPPDPRRRLRLPAPARRRSDRLTHPR